MIKETLKKYIIDNNFYVDDIFIFTNEKNKYSFLLGKNGCSMIVDEYLLRNIKSKKLDENLKVKLIQHGLAGLKKPKITLPKNQNENIYFIIDVTKRCNFNCIYCFRDLNDNRVIDNKVLKDICQFIVNIVNERKLKNVTVQVWGGEPLLAIEKIEYIYNFFENTNVKLKIDIETNGSLITETIAKKLFDMKVNVGVSLDGTEEEQDIQRRLSNGKSSNELVKRGIKNLKKYYKNNISGITVITKYNYKNFIYIVNYFANELKISNMKFNIVKDNPNASENKLGLTLEEVRAFANTLFDSINLYNLMGVKFSEGNLQMRMSNLMERSNKNYCISNGCKGGINLISIDMKGNIYPCEMTDYENVKITSIYKNGKLSTNYELVESIKLAKKNNIYFRKKINNECKNCPWYYYCQGGCTSRIIYSNGKMKYDEVECELNKILYERIIDQMLKNIRLER